MVAKIVKHGDELSIDLSPQFVEEAQLSEGATVELTLEKGRLRIRSLMQPAESLEELLAGITEENLHPEVDFGPPQGRELL